MTDTGRPGSTDCDAARPDSSGPSEPTESRGDGSGSSGRSLAPLMGAVYVVAGIAHFLAPKRFAEAVPPAFPRPVGLVYLSGIAEILLGVGVALRRTRRASAWGVVALLVAVFPANVHLARREVLSDLVPDRLVGPARLAALVRLPFQGVLIGWALRYARSDDDPASEAEA
ncbi:MauE/DoxX family redox-associated membrane protein [Halorubrum sp. 2020YC2]|uniref:DoxX family protein n=1 Tax=Halorubrum sp. 2020YC2 TaxID=2836432 RepID=UPI001BE94D24|nr:MauE/DoxX family redox-associated membrane protein [Halorubrum sp. 2020YC2]QWC18077.1 DoxX family membrane protein [Halorubrum sp. 2020YC2]